MRLEIICDRSSASLFCRSSTLAPDLQLFQEILCDAWRGKVAVPRGYLAARNHHARLRVRRPERVVECELCSVDLNAYVRLLLVFDYRQFQCFELGPLAKLVFKLLSFEINRHRAD